MNVGDRDGFGRFGVLDEDAEGLLCHECGRRFTHLGLHAWRGHGMSATEYRRAHGLSRTGLVTTPTLETLTDNARRTFAAKPAFIRARDPKAARAFQRTGPDAISPAGLAAIRASNHKNLGTTRHGIEVTCEWCGNVFCPLSARLRRRFCSRSCASRHNRRQQRP